PVECLDPGPTGVRREVRYRHAASFVAREPWRRRRRRGVDPARTPANAGEAAANFGHNRRSRHGTPLALFRGRDDSPSSPPPSPSEGPVREYVVVVDHTNRALGAVEKLKAHRLPVLHRAVSVLLFHPNGALLLQRRAAGKYHSPLQWSNTCCGHPLPGESSRRAAARRLQAEMGISTTLHP